MIIARTRIKNNEEECWTIFLESWQVQPSSNAQAFLLLLQSEWMHCVIVARTRIKVNEEECWRGFLESWQVQPSSNAQVQVNRPNFSRILFCQ